MNDQAIEEEIKAKGLTAPRISLGELRANIAAEWYFTAREGVEGAVVRSALPDVGGESMTSPYGWDHLNTLTFCVLVLRNGFTVTGESACASPENFDAEIGRKIAYQNAEQKVWSLMGYEMKERMHQQTLPAQAPTASHLSPHQQRVIAEREQLADRIQKLEAFLHTDLYAGLPEDEQQLLKMQADAMVLYLGIINTRTSKFA